MADDTLTIFFRETDAIAQRIRERFDYQLKQEVAAKERTIDIQIDKTSNTKATKLAYQYLEKLQQWIETEKEQRVLRAQRAEKFKSDLFWVGYWVGSGKSGIFFFICAILISATLTGVTIINLPTFLSCPNTKSLCYLVYQMRFNNKSVILPQQTKDILAEYERNKKKPRQRK